jgi:hypothetical protein
MKIACPEEIAYPSSPTEVDWITDQRRGLTLLTRFPRLRASGHLPCETRPLVGDPSAVSVGTPFASTHAPLRCPFVGDDRVLRQLSILANFILLALIRMTPRKARFKLFGVPGDVVTVDQDPVKKTKLNGISSVPLKNDSSGIWTSLFGDNVLYEIENGYCHWNGAVLDHRGFVIQELSVPVTNRDSEFWKPGLHSLKRDIPYIGESIAYVDWGHHYHHNYFHWLYDVLPRLLLIKNNVSFNKVYVNEDKDFQTEILSAFGFDSLHVLPARKYPWLLAKTVYGVKFLNSFNTLTPDLVSYVRQVMLEKFGGNNKSCKNNGNKRLYISRSDAHGRLITNENTVVEYLSSIGFERLCPGQLSMEEQVSLFSQAECVVGPHGAAMSNLTFCRKGCSVIELFPDSYKIDLYKTIAGAVGARYVSLGGENMSSMDDYWNHQHTDFSVDLSRLKSLLPG